ncbi:saccharopine dehydrogenase NADP-binding domain-containing protein [Rhodococcus daqingensis]|uniref:Saccharopine dehydrogenase NADP-binding domain-containing protein n=1 Tax=Rhodococcus daqingensis TaxID=2479363 RepID=A0ABW2S4X5_9NOCA
MTTANSTESTTTIAVYGATGVTGASLLTELNRRGIASILVGRNADRMRAAAAAAGTPAAEVRVADLGDHDALVTAFTGADAVISSLPAYVEHGEAVLAAAIDAGAHYTDMSGEQLFLKRVFDDYADRAEAAGVTVVPGITNSNLPGDLLGHLISRRLTGPVEIAMSLVGTKEGNGSKGSARTLLAGLDWFRTGGWHFEDGELRTGGNARRPEMTFPGATEPTSVSKFPQPPVLTIPRHSDVSYVEGVLETAFHSQLGGLSAEIVESLPDEPTPGLSYDFVVDAFGADGRMVRGVVSGRDAYVDSALMAVEAAVRLTDGAAESGALAAAEAFDAEGFLDALAPFGITWTVDER